MKVKAKNNRVYLTASFKHPTHLKHYALATLPPLIEAVMEEAL